MNDLNTGVHCTADPASRGALGVDDVHVWYFRTHDGAETSPADGWKVDGEAVLSDGERVRMERFVFEKDRRLFLEAHVLLRRVLSRYADAPPESWCFAEESGGKPNIVGPFAESGLKFNLSHTRGMAAVAVALGDEIGVDVEQVIGPLDMDLARRFFSPVEAAKLEHTPAEEQLDRFFEYWTLKEAYLKARGSGLAAPLSDFTVRAIGTQGAEIRFCQGIDDDPQHWQFHRCRLSPRHRLAVALRRSRTQPMRVVVREWCPDVTIPH